MKLVFDEDWDVSEDDYEPLTKEEIEISEDIFNLLQSIIDDNDTLTEEFVSQKCLKRHFRDHCMSNDGKKSRKTDVLYDFTDINKYRLYENEINDKVTTTKYKITSLYDLPLVNKYFRKLFEVNVSIYFTTSCGFTNSTGMVTLGLNSFGTDKTRNYSGNNTINFLVMTPENKTISMYPIDSHYFETKFNNIISRHNNEKINFKINNER